jgi:hypothetical protein
VSGVLRALAIILTLVAAGASASALAAEGTSTTTTATNSTSTSTGLTTTTTGTSTSVGAGSASATATPSLYTIPPDTATVESSTSSEASAFAIPPSVHNGPTLPAVVRQTAQPSLVLARRQHRPGHEHGRHVKRHAKRHGSAAGGKPAAGALLAGEAPGPSPIGATVGLPPEPLAAAGIGGQEGHPLTGTPFPPGEVPSFLLESYDVPPFLLAIYQSAAARYRVPWEVLAAINEVETDYGRDLAVSSAGAEGWMQFLPQTWAEYGVDATGAGVRDPYNPADAIFAAARYLRAAGAAQNLDGAVFAYNHSSLYVESVMLRARLLAYIPANLLRALTALGQGHATGLGAASIGLTASQWQALQGHLAQLSQPRVSLTATAAALPDRADGVDLPPPAQGSLPQFALPSFATQAGTVSAPVGTIDTSAGETPAGADTTLTPQTSPVSGGLSFQPQLGLPAGSVNMVGAAPEEAPDAIWATGQIGAVPASVEGQQLKETGVLLRHTPESGWQIVPVEDETGKALPFNGTPSITAKGGAVLLSSVADEQGKQHQTLIVRSPGGHFVQAAPPSEEGAEPVLAAGETLYPAPGSQSAPLFTAIDEQPGEGDAGAGARVGGAGTGAGVGGSSGAGSAGTEGAGEGEHTGALIVPAAATSTAVVHYDGTHWTREPICTQYSGSTCTDKASDLKALAIAASSPQNAWLLASSETEPLMLFKRTPASGGGGGATVWVQSQPASWGPAPEDKVFARSSGQMLTVTNQGVWVDAAFSTPTAGEAVDLSLLLNPAAPSEIEGTWCYPQSACGQGSLGAPLPAEYRSFAWPGTGDGTRIIAGLPDGALLRLQGSGDFSYLVGGGGIPSTGAAFASPEEGWIVSTAGAGANSAQIEHVTTNPAPSTLQAWPLPFRRPLLAIATQPGTTPGEQGAQALAVGDQGQIARYLPGEGWTAEFLYTASGTVATPRLRGVAWPEANRAYAVGDEGAMWVWRSETGLWEPDPAKPLDFHANLTGIAFSPLNPAVGYAVGKQGVLLAYDKTWEAISPPEAKRLEEELHVSEQSLDFTAIAFASGEALATYRVVNAAGEEEEVGGLIANSGSGWHVNSGAQALLSSLGDPRATVLSKVAGLPDGGAVAAGPGVVIERDSTTSSWRFSTQPLPEAQNIAALAAIREGPNVRALVSIDLDSASNPNNSTDFYLDIDNPPPTGIGQPLAYVGPDPLPVSGYLLRETADGWQDLENQAYPGQSSTPTDLPSWPDAVLALDVDPGGDQGWVVGGQTGGFVEQSKLGGAPLVSQSAAALRLGAGPAPPQSAGAPIAVPSGEATFAVGGNAQCAAPCADFANEGVGPDAWLSSAVARAATIGGLHAFLYTGARIAAGADQTLSPEAFARELDAYRSDLNAAGSLPVYVAPSPSDADKGGGLASFTAALGNDAPAGAALPGTPVPPAGSGAYAFESEGTGGSVRVIVLDFSSGALAPGELSWLAEQLDQARAVAHVPAVVMGNADIVEAGAPNYDGRDAAALSGVLLADGASAYLFDSPEHNRVEQIGTGAQAIPALGTGTLGYTLAPAIAEEFLGASGFLLVSVDAAARNATTNVAPVSATLAPNIAQLAIDASDGTLLRRSQVALFQGLARRPGGGLELTGEGPSAETAPDPYVPIPERCIGADCTQFIAPTYSFASSRPDIGNFVEQEPSNPNPRAVALVNGKPVPDPQSGLFCAFNAGTTTVSITAGGLTYSEQVTVQAGSVQQPCGTVPLINPPVREVSASAPVSPPPPASPPPSSPSPLAVVPPPPPPAVPVPPPAPAPAPPHPALRAPAPFFFSPPLAVPLLAAVLPPPPVLARPIPPSGSATVSVFSPAAAPKEEQEDEEAVESARASMSAYRPEAPHLPALGLLALCVLAAGAGVGIRRRPRSGRRSRIEPAFAQGRATSGRRATSSSHVSR